MIPLWLTPSVIRATVIGLLTAVIFGFGFWASHALSQAKIERLKADLQTLQANNQQCLDQNTRAFKSIEELETALKSQNLAISQLAEDSAAALAEQRLKSRLALEAYQRASQEATEQYRADKEALLARMALLTASESCHEAWVEVVK